MNTHEESCERRRCNKVGSANGVKPFQRKRSDEESIEDFEYWREVPIYLCPEHAGNHDPA